MLSGRHDHLNRIVYVRIHLNLHTKGSSHYNILHLTQAKSSVMYIVYIGIKTGLALFQGGCKRPECVTYQIDSFKTRTFLELSEIKFSIKVIRTFRTSRTRSRMYTHYNLTDALNCNILLVLFINPEQFLRRDYCMSIFLVIP